MPSKSVMKVPFGFKGVHHCKAVVMMCVDFRFRKQTMYFAREYLRLIAFDFAGLPGSSRGVSKASKMATSCIQIPCDIHNVETIVIVHHEDCGAYGGSKRFNYDKEKEQKFHEDKLKEAKRMIMDIYPEKEIILVYARLVDDDENIEFLVME